MTVDDAAARLAWAHQDYRSGLVEYHDLPPALSGCPVTGRPCRVVVCSECCPGTAAALYDACRAWSALADSR